MGKSGLAYEWFQQWQTNDLPYVPLQLGLQGYSSIMIRQLFTAIKRIGEYANILRRCNY